MTFRETLDMHLAAIHNRDLDALRATLPDEWLTLIMADGRLVTSVEEFLQLHADWFQSPTWSLEATPVSVLESADLGVAVLHLDYRDKPPVHETSYLTLVFQRQGDRWLMVQDQNTPIKSPPAGASG